MTWQQILSEAVTDPVVLAERLELDPASIGVDPTPRFQVRVPAPFIARMIPGHPDDPLLRQVLSVTAEQQVVDGFVTDPLEEHEGVLRGVLHKYRSRILVVLRGGCAINCRYCFRRHFPYRDNTFRMADLGKLQTYLNAHPEVNEVILSGGDPLMADDACLAELFDALAGLPHVRRLRIHTRLPVVIPARITEDLCHLFATSRIPVVCVLHINHPQEIDAELSVAIESLRAHCHSVLNQAVLLRGVNSTAPVLVELSEALFRVGVQPYYLNVLDQVAGSAHFALPDAEIAALYDALLHQLPGFLVPKLVQEVPGVGHKVPWMAHRR
ncbi:MAG: EF-P beta-lysylation protein EpmB [Litorivicinaceae bacterium]